MTEPDAGRTPRVRLSNLQIARALAATLVVVFHASGDIPKLSKTQHAFASDFFRFGNAGVILFFVISGFIITYAHWNDIGKIDRLPHYVFRRVTRIYPLFWVLCAFILPLYFIFPAVGKPFERELSSVIGTIFLLPVPPKPIIGVAWSLVLEILFYAMFALIIATRKIGAILFALWLAAASLNVFLGTPDIFILSRVFSPYYFDFALGMIVAITFQMDWAKNRDWQFLAGGGALFLATGIAMIVTGAPEVDPAMLYQLGFGIGSAGIVMGMVLRDRAGKHATAALVLLGNATYSIYLFHWVVQGGVTKVLARLHGGAVPSLLLLIVYAIPEIALGYLVYLYVERPLLFASGRFGPKRHKVPALALSGQ